MTTYRFFVMSLLFVLCESSTVKQPGDASILFFLQNDTLPLYCYTSQFYSWKQGFMIIKFRCAVWLYVFEQPTACDLILQTFGNEEGNMVS